MKTNKTIQFFRHAKSSWKHNLPDHDRPLKQRGINDVKLMSNYLKTNFLIPDLILSSTANRAKTTAQLFIENLQLTEVSFCLKKELYDFSGESVLNQIKNCDNSVNVLAIFGHNFAITELSNILGDKYIENVTTSRFVQIEFEQNCWQKVKNGKTQKIVFPKLLK